jgi:hypothetical protein
VRDLLFIVVVVGFFAVAVIFVRACELVLGPGDTAKPDRRQ